MGIQHAICKVYGAIPIKLRTIEPPGATSFNIFREHEIVGRVGLSYINKSNKTANTGYQLAKQTQGAGIIINAVKKMVTLGFEELRLNRIEIKAATINSRSKAIPEKNRVYM